MAGVARNSLVGVGVLVSIVCLALAPTTDAQTPEQRFFDWSQPSFDPEVYQARRQRMTQTLHAHGGGVLVVPSRGGTSAGFTFRQTDDFLYFTGLELPDSVLIIDSGAGDDRDEASHIFAPRTDGRFDNPSRRNDFPGMPLADDPTIAAWAGIPIHRYDELEMVLARAVANHVPLRINLGHAGEPSPSETDYVNRWSDSTALVAHLGKRFPNSRLLNAYEEIARLRMVHDQAEITAMRRVIDLTVEAIRHASGFVRPGVDERGLEAELEAAYKRGGGQRLAFASIIKSGPNSLWPWRVLAASYDRRNRVMQAGELVIFDVGTELDSYVSDVGRTFPVSGSFTESQKRALDMQRGVSDAIIAAVRPGVTFAELKRIAVEAIPVADRAYMQAGGFFGHHIGLSSGDPSLAELPLQPGMIFTVEPWYYNHDSGISVFVEDVVLVTKDGVENLTRSLPRTADELEKMVAMLDSDADP